MRFSLLFIILLFPLSSVAQISAPGSTSVLYTDYPSMPDLKHSVFIYCNASGTETGTLNAVNPKCDGSVYNFSWYKWNDATKSFSVFLKSDNGVSSSQHAGLEEGGYKIDITGSGNCDTSLIAWIVMDEPPVAEASLAQQLCNRVALDGNAEATVDEFYYRDPSNGAVVSFSNEITFLWSSTPPSVIPYPSIDIDPVTYSPPLEDVTYKLEVFSLGCKSEASFFYESIHVKADALVEPVTGEAPLEVMFINKSVRGSKFEWDFGDNTTSSLENPEPHIYNKPGLYYPKLRIESDLLCIDSVKLDSIYVEPSRLNIPNAFTPNEDGYNDRFIVDARSLRYLNVEIFSRSGLKVYGYSGDSDGIKSWEGWDGKVNNSSIEARPGIYFYIIRALGWDDIRYDSKEYRGFLYLYR
ncbi:MAG TPA: gliding motility-associated C-terminal domain-containing protein [Bacteroidales bacterium]|nr:gliding motility-associated C-terminal domain-containing protein [Bacteroidales bacterium]